MTRTHILYSLLQTIHLYFEGSDYLNTHDVMMYAKGQISNSYKKQVSKAMATIL